MELVEYATIGTITDLMPLKGENRVICWHGLYKMNNNPSIIIATLQKLLKIKQIDSTTIGFLIDPSLMPWDEYQTPTSYYRCCYEMIHVQRNGKQSLTSTINEKS